MLRRGQIALLLVVTSGLFSVLLAVAVNVATGGQLPEPLTGYGWLAWPTVGLLAVIGIFLAWLQQRLPEPTAVPEPKPDPVPGPPTPAELPAAPTFFGLQADIATVGEILADGAQVVVLAAAPGTGKTALALRLAHDQRRNYPDGQLYAALRGASPDPVPPEAVLARFLGALGRPDEERRGSVEELAARFRSAVADLKVLVLLDDARDVDQVAPLLPGGPGCLTVVTSRWLLAAVPGAVALPIGGLREDEALDMLAAAAGRDRITGDAEGARRIVEACAGLPLAVRIAGTRLRALPGWTATVLADRLADERRRLDELQLGYRAVRSTFRMAYDGLPETDQLVFRRAGSHPGQLFGLGMAAARCGLDGRVVAATLDRLHAAFLVEAPAPDRYRLHDLLRLFAVELLDQLDSPAEALGRQIGWLTGHPHIGAALPGEVLAVLHAADRYDELAEDRWELVEAVHPLLTAAEDHPYRLRLWQLALGAATALDDDARRVRALRWVSHAHGISGAVALELETAEESLAIAEVLGAPYEIAQSVRRVGDALRAQSRYAEAEAMLLRALDLQHRLGGNTEVDILVALATLYNTFWQPEKAMPLLERAMALLPLLPEEDSLHGWTFGGLSLAHKFAGRIGEAVEMNERAFAVAHRLDDKYLLGYCYQERGYLLEEQQRYAEAETAFREMLAIFEQIGHGGGVSGAWAGIAVVYDKLGRRPEALDAIEQAVARLDRLGDRIRSGELRLHRSALLNVLGRTDEAIAERVRAEELIGDVPVHRDQNITKRLPPLP
jgi:tetratricopeptide (TPR) repeat protein